MCCNRSMSNYFRSESSSCDSSSAPFYVPMCQSDLARLAEVAEVYQLLQNLQNNSGCACNTCNTCSSCCNG